MLDFIVNPIAGKGRAQAARRAIGARLTALGTPHRFHETRAPREAVEIAGKLTRAGADRVVAIGGDGTLNEVLNGLADPSKSCLGLIPAGGGNDFAAAARIPRDPLEALRIVLDGRPKPTDYMECGGVRGINIIGAGIDVDILRAYAKLGIHGPVGYLLALLKTLFSFQFYEFSERVDGRDVPHRAFIACAGNGRRCGGGITLCPKASLDDGLLDIVIIDDLKKSGIPAAFVKLMRKQILDLPQTVFRRGDRLAIHSDAPLPIQIDGEIYDDLPFDVRLVTGQLKMYRP